MVVAEVSKDNSRSVVFAEVSKGKRRHVVVAELSKGKSRSVVGVWERADVLLLCLLSLPYNALQCIVPHTPYIKHDYLFI